MTDGPEIGYYDDDNDPYADEDPDLIREDAFKKWQRHRARCSINTLRLALDHAQDLGDPVAERAIYAELK